jgi:methionine-rich copper-binding protein CopC
MLALLRIAAILLSMAGAAWAHSGLVRAEPPEGSVLAGAPEELKLYFSENLEPAYSSVEVRDGSGAQVDRQDARVDRADPRLLRVTLPPLAKGEYSVTWRVLSIDSHVTEGRFGFTVE